VLTEIANSDSNTQLLASLDAPPKPEPLPLRLQPNVATVQEVLAAARKKPDPLYTEDSIGKVAWQLLLRDGRLEHVHGGFAKAAGTALTQEQRAKAIVKEVPSPLVAAGLTAAWVYCGQGPLEYRELAYRQGMAGRLKTNWKTWSAMGLDNSLTHIAGLRITNINRTLADVASRHPPAVAIPWVAAMVAAGANLQRAALVMENRYRVVGRSQIRQTFDAVARMQAD